MTAYTSPKYEVTGNTGFDECVRVQPDNFDVPSDGGDNLLKHILSTIKVQNVIKSGWPLLPKQKRSPNFGDSPDSPLNSF